MRSLHQAWILAALALALPAEPTTAGETKRPNIIYIMCDDLGYGDLGCYGQKRIATPAIDRLAEQGMKFTAHYSGHTVCRPSRLSLWTGKHTGHTAISANSTYVFRPADVTVAELVHGAGYATGGVGKWAMGGDGTTGHPNENGFDFWMGYLDQGAAHNYYPEFLWRNGEKVPLPGNEEGPKKRVSVKRVTYSHDRMTEAALEFIRRERQGPFLLHVHWTIPHANNEGGRATGDGLEVPDHGVYADREWPEPEKGYAAMNGRMDRDVGRIVALLEELDIARRTLVVFTSDNGPHHEGRHQHTFFDSNGPLRGYKRDLYEGGIRVPLLAWWPGTIQAGSVTDHPSAFWDFLPTACELAGVAPPDGIDGLSYVPTLLDRPEGQKKHDYLYWRFRGKVALRRGKWKGVRTGRSRPLELYDLEKDVGEEHDLAGSHPDVVSRLEKLMAQAVGPPPVPALPGSATRDGFHF